MKSILPAWAYALCLAIAMALGLPSAAVAGNHKGKGCYAHRALTICKHNDSWSAVSLKRTYAAKHKKKRWGHRHSRHRAADRHHRKHHAHRHHGKHVAAHIDLVTREQSIVVGACKVALPKLPGGDACVHGAMIYAPKVERVTGKIENSERGRTGRYFARGYYDPNSWRYRPTDRQVIRAFHKKHGMKH